jgi:hypothetical protein
MNLPKRILITAALPALALLTVSCGTTDTGGVAQITKVNPYHLKPGMFLQTEDQMIAFEQMHHLHGAVTAEDYNNRFGHHFTVFWKTESKGAPFTVRVEYTAANTGSTVHTKEVAIASAKGRNTTNLSVTGAEYTQNGAINSWRALILSGGQTVSEFKSFQWK